ncbi:MAG: ATP-binding protein, partial [Acidimicrobiales bacterium]
MPQVLRRRTLSSQIVAMQVLILVAAMVAGFAVVTWRLQAQLDHQYEQQSLDVAQSVAASDSIQDAVTAGDPGGELEAMAAAVWRRTGARYVVITNARGIRYSHPNRALIGLPVYSDPEPASSEPFRTGKPWVGIQTGTLGRTARGKAPIFDESGRLVGEVSVGFTTGLVAAHLRDELPTIALYLLGALLLGTLASLGLARRLKRQTFGLELDEIAGLLQEREAMLHGIAEGVLGYDHHELVLLANDSARELLRLPPDSVGRPLCELVRPGRLADVVSGKVEGSDMLVVAGDRVLVANRMPIRVHHRRHLGWVVTLHDRTEPEGLLRELDTVTGLTEALRAQSHEFSNRLHTLVGLVELGRYDEAIAFVTDVSAARGELADRLMASVGDPMVVALLLAKTSVAGEKGVDLRVADSQVDGDLADVGDVLTVVGNLLDNAIDAAPQKGHIVIRTWTEGNDVLVGFRDDGAGISEENRPHIFEPFFTSKPVGVGTGLGLSIAYKIVTVYFGGDIHFQSQP